MNGDVTSARESIISLKLTGTPKKKTEMDFRLFYWETKKM